MQLNPVIIFGAGPLGLVALDIFRSHGMVVYGFLDDDPATHGAEIGDVTVLGRTDDEKYLKLIGQKCDAFVAVDDNRLRKTLAGMLNERRHVQPINAIHAQAVVAASATLHYGTLIGPGAIINSGADIGNHCILQAGCIVEASAKVADYAQVGSGSIIGAGVSLAEGAFIGAGANIVAGLSVGKNARVGAGSVVVEPVSNKETVFGNPAKKV